MAQAVCQLTPSSWWWVELHEGQVISCNSGGDVLQFKRYGSVEEAAPGCGDHLRTAGHDDQAKDGLMAECSQRHRPQLIGDFIEPI
jgi:hypothetical protein